MKYHIHKAVVIGSGTMGAAIAAHLANAGVPVTLLDIAPKDAPADDKAARNKIVNEGWERCLKARPANLMSSELKTFVKLGNLEDDFDVVAEADWICEAVVENLTPVTVFRGQSSAPSSTTAIYASRNLNQRASSSQMAVGKLSFCKNAPSSLRKVSNDANSSINAC